MLEAWRTANFLLGGMVLAWMVTVTRDRRRRNDHLHGGLLGIGTGLYASGVIIGQAWALKHNLVFSPGSIPVFFGSLAILCSMCLVLRDHHRR